MPVTFVTSFFYIYNKEITHKSTLWRIDRFKEIVKSGINICIYVCPIFEPYIREIEREYPNLKIMKVMEIKDTFISDVCSKYEYTLPSVRNEDKDNAEFMMLINSKTEFMADAIMKNPWFSTHFAWIDFNISHIFRDKEKTLSYLYNLSQQDFVKNFLLIQGCWRELTENNEDYYKNNVNWRFCGGFLIGDNQSIMEFNGLYKRYFPQFLEKEKKLLWEVNMWAWLERHAGLNAIWNYSDHTDIIIKIPKYFYAKSLHELGCNKFLYNYPRMVGYKPGSASYVYFKGKHLLNTRYVNYYYDYNELFQFTDWNYYYYNNTMRGVIMNENVFSLLETQENDYNNVRRPVIYEKMNETIDMPKHKQYSRGIEDLRLYVVDDKVKYIATTVDYYHTTGNRMIIGDYDIENYCYKNSQIIEPPGETFLEKNWIPIVNNGKELFIYKWSPLEIGHIIETEDGVKKLKILQTFEETRSQELFNDARGSTHFIERDEELIGVVHFSRRFKRFNKYFHMLVVLDKETLKPKKYSDPFYFEQVGIEYCIGFDIRYGKYWFWISQYDNNPMLVSIDMNKLGIMNVF